MPLCAPDRARSAVRGREEGCCPRSRGADHRKRRPLEHRLSDDPRALPEPQPLRAEQKSL